MSTDNDSVSACNGCSLSRREFLRNSATAIAAVGIASTLPLQSIQALGIDGASRSKVRYPIPAADAISFDAANEVIISRAGSAVYAFALACPHQNVAVRQAPGGGGFQCPKHKSKYKPDGTFISGRATRNMDRYAVERDGSVLIVDTATVFESDKDATHWNAASVSL